MSENNEAPAPTSKFTYPFPVSDTAAGGGSDAQEASGPQEYYEALAQAEDGFYPIGYNGQWHGGIHFGAQTGAHLAQDGGVRCIADGEVIAWKIDEEYPQVEYASCDAATYSTGFVLVRHRLQLPRADRGQAGDAGADGSAAGNQDESEQQQEPSLLFYSLYIHLLDWAGYSDDSDKVRPAFWGEPAYLVGEEANDSDRNRNPHIPEGGVGLNLRNAANAIVGVALRGTQLHLGEQRGTSGYYAVTGLECGTVLPTGLDLAGAYAYKDELTPVPAEPPSKGEVVIPDEPVCIAAGDLVGHLGQYQRYIDMNPLCSSSDERELMQIDVFTTDDIEAFIEQSRARATQLADRHKTLLLVDQGARLVRAPEDGGSPTGEQLAARRHNADGPEVAHPRVVPIKALGEAVTEEGGTRWWNVEAGNGDGESVWGWVCERDHANVRLCTPWDWPGFEIVQVDDTRPDQFYANQVHRQGNAAQNEESELQERGEPAESGSIFRKLYDLIDQDGDRKIVSDEIRPALRKPWLAQALSHLIVHHESEWSGPMDKWDAIDKLIPERREKDWKKEKERIDSLLWWKEVKGQHGLPNDEPLVACNLHPVGLIANFSINACCTLDKDAFESIFGSRRIFHHRNMPRDGSAYDASTEEFVDLLNSGFERYGFTECKYKHHFLAQCYHESDHFNTTQEYASGWDYDLSRYPESVCNPNSPDHTTRKCRRRRQIISEGNTSIGDGPRYKGRGIIQLTWKGTYRAYQNYSGSPVVENPETVASDLSLAVDSAFWFWARFKGEHINTMIDRYYEEAERSGMTGDALENEVVRRVTRVVNGGDRGLAERQALYRRILELMK